MEETHGQVLRQLRDGNHAHSMAAARGTRVCRQRSRATARPPPTPAAKAAGRVSCPSQCWPATFARPRLHAARFAGGAAPGIVCGYAAPRVKPDV